MSFVNVSIYYDIHRPEINDVSDILTAASEIGKKKEKNEISLNPECILYNEKTRKVKFMKKKNKGEGYVDEMSDLITYFEKIAIYSEDDVKAIISEVKQSHASGKVFKIKFREDYSYIIFIVFVGLLLLLYYGYVRPIHFYS